MAEIKGTSGNDTLTGGGGNDTIQGLAGDDELFGLAGSDRLEGGTGSDRLSGGKGTDQLIGSAGNDTYEIDTTGDRITEGNNQGIDVVESLISFTLSSNLEILALKGTANINGTGNGFNNILTGNSGTNVLKGLAGNDRLSGGSGGDDTLDGGQGRDILLGSPGNNTFMIDNVGDRIEYAGPGVDTVRSEVSFVLSSNLENLVLLKQAISGTGNGLANRMTGNGAANILVSGQGSDTLEGQNGRDSLNGGKGADTLLGGIGLDTLNGGQGSDNLSGEAGDDTLTGGGGLDQFIYNTGRSFRDADIGIDTITDFRTNQDVIQLSRDTFGLSSIPGIGFSSASEFAVVENNDLAQNSAARVVFSRGSRTLFYNPNGSSSGFGDTSRSGAFVVLNTNALSRFDFILVP